MISAAALGDVRGAVDGDSNIGRVQGGGVVECRPEKPNRLAMRFSAMMTRSSAAASPGRTGGCSAEAARSALPRLSGLQTAVSRHTPRAMDPKSRMSAHEMTREPLNCPRSGLFTRRPPQPSAPSAADWPRPWADRGRPRTPRKVSPTSSLSSRGRLMVRLGSASQCQAGESPPR